MATANRNISFAIPLILRLNSSTPSNGGSNQAGPVGGIFLVDPFLFQRDGNGGEKGGHPPASKASIDAMESVEIDKEDDDPCAVCLEDLEIGEKARKMPCGHKFHGECVGRWLRVHGTCPVCRHEMPVDENDDSDKKTSDEENRRGIWVGFRVGWVDSPDGIRGSSFPDSNQEMQ